MNPLEVLKEKLKYKPVVGDKKPVAVVIGKPEIVDETYIAFPRKDLLDKFEKSGITKVTMKPVLKAQQEDVLPPEKPTKARKIGKKKLKIVEEVPGPNIESVVLEPDAPIRKIRKKIIKGVAIIGPETTVEFGDISKRLPKQQPNVIEKTSAYYMNNREIFVNFINSLFDPYKKELQENSDSISCDTIGQGDFSLLTHQKIVRDYINLYTPYRGLLLYHGLGSGKTCTSIAIAEGMKNSKKIIIMTPASLRTNYMEELKKCGDSLYRKNQYWEWISVDDNPELVDPLSASLGLPREYIRRKQGAWLINNKKEDENGKGKGRKRRTTRIR